MLHLYFLLEIQDILAKSVEIWEVRGDTNGIMYKVNIIALLGGPTTCPLAARASKATLI